MEGLSIRFMSNINNNLSFYNMKKLILLFITLTTLANISYASFPITKNNTVLTAENLVIEDPNDEEQEEPSWMVFIYILNAIILISGF